MRGGYTPLLIETTGYLRTLVKTSSDRDRFDSAALIADMKLWPAAKEFSKQPRLAFSRSQQLQKIVSRYTLIFRVSAHVEGAEEARSTSESH